MHFLPYIKSVFQIFLLPLTSSQSAGRLASQLSLGELLLLNRIIVITEHTTKLLPNSHQVTFHSIENTGDLKNNNFHSRYLTKNQIQVWRHKACTHYCQAKGIPITQGCRFSIYGPLHIVVKKTTLTPECQIRIINKIM